MSTQKMYLKKQIGMDVPSQIEDVFHKLIHQFYFKLLCQTDTHTQRHISHSLSFFGLLCGPCQLHAKFSKAFAIARGVLLATYPHLLCVYVCLRVCVCVA